MNTTKISSQLIQLGWDWNHPRIQNYLLTVATLLRGNFKTVDEIPSKYLQHLEKLLKIYQQCDHLLKLLGLTWESPVIQTVFLRYPYGDRMPLSGWNDLYEILEKEWFVNGGGF